MEHLDVIVWQLSGSVKVEGFLPCQVFCHISLEEGFGFGLVKYVEVSIISVVIRAYVLTPLEQSGPWVRFVCKKTLYCKPASSP